MKAIIRYKVHSQKIQFYFSDILTQKILQDICFLVTKQRKFKVIQDFESYNRGRLVTVEYNGLINYISLSETQIDGRNSSVQSIPSALNLFYDDETKKKNLYYYILPHIGNLNTNYHKFIYRLMITAGFKFLNKNEIVPFKSIEDIVSERDALKGSNRSNNSTYVTKSSNTIQIYGKTYGASKYETTLICVAISMIATMRVELFNICEQNLKKLPKSSIATLNKLGKVSIVDTSLKLDKLYYIAQKDKTILRSPTYVYNLLQLLGYKKCALCDCQIPEIIQGAHIWAVSEIGKENLSDDKKIEFATNGNNGLWLCQNHHKLFDTNIVTINNSGKISFRNELSNTELKYLNEITTIREISPKIMTKEFMFFLNKRNTVVNHQI
jgi:predicted restriction endonuclease